MQSDIGGEIEISMLEEGCYATVKLLAGGNELMRRLRSIGVREGQRIKMLTRHPMGGPVVVDIEGRQATIGRGMSHKIFVEACKPC